MQVPFEPVVIATFLAIIVAADRRLKAAAQPLRLRLAETAEEFLQIRNLPSEARNHVKFMLCHAFDMRGFLLLSVVMVPVVAFVFALFRKSILHRDQLGQLEPAARQTFFEICRLHNRITLANHWILLPLVELEIVLLMPLAIIVRAVIYGRIPESGGRESVITFIETKRMHLRHSHAAANSQ